MSLLIMQPLVDKGLGALTGVQTVCVPQMELHFDRQNGILRYVWWAQDGAPAHRLIAVHEGLRELFNERVIAINHPVESNGPQVSQSDTV